MIDVKNIRSTKREKRETGSGVRLTKVHTKKEEFALKSAGIFLQVTCQHSVSTKVAAMFSSVCK